MRPCYSSENVNIPEVNMSKCLFVFTKDLVRTLFKFFLNEWQHNGTEEKPTLSATTQQLVGRCAHTTQTLYRTLL